jgi:predicted TIM-barrel fold metal-dependent hydrolase
MLSRRSVLAGVALAPFLGNAARAAAPAVPLYDSHIHFFTNDIARYPIDPRGAREPEEVMRARIVSHPVMPAPMLALWDALGVSGGVGVQYRGAYKGDNSYLLDVADAFPERIATEIMLEASNPESPAMLADFAAHRRITAVRLTGFDTGDGTLPWLNSPEALTICSLARDLSLPICMTYLPPRPASTALAAVRDLAGRFPDNIIVLEHLGWLGGANSDNGLLPDHFEMVGLPNILFKWTTLDLDILYNAGIATSAFLRTAVDTFGAGRLMWGSDFGNSTRPYRQLVAEAHAACGRLTESEARQVLQETGQHIFRHRAA